MKVNCLSCGHLVDLRGSYDDYQGQIKCFACGALMVIRTEDGEIKSVEYVSDRPHGSESTTREMQHAAADAADEKMKY